MALKCFYIGDGDDGDDEGEDGDDSDSGGDDDSVQDGGDDGQCKEVVVEIVTIIMEIVLVTLMEVVTIR